MKKIALVTLAIAASVPAAARPAQNPHAGGGAHGAQGQHGHAAGEEHDGHAVHRQHSRPETQAAPAQAGHQGHRAMSGCCADANNNGRMDCCEQGSTCACCAPRETGTAPARR